MHFAPQTTREPQIRLFRSDFLEALTRIHPAVVLVVWSPVIAWLLWRGRDAAAPLLPALALGLLVWSLFEYVMHRFVFHFAPRDPKPWLRRLLFLFHGIHHVQPWDKQRLVMPPGVSVPLALLVFLPFEWLLVEVCAAPAWLDRTFAGFLLGYVAYDMLHYATHHLPLPGRLGKALKRHHLLHHHQSPDARYGVTSGLWDAVFRTLPRRGEASSR